MLKLRMSYKIAESMVVFLNPARDILPSHFVNLIDTKPHLEAAGKSSLSHPLIAHGQRLP